MINAMKEYHITCSTDDNYVQHCMAMLCSLFENNAGYVFHVHLLHHALSRAWAAINYSIVPAI